MPARLCSAVFPALATALALAVAGCAGDANPVRDLAMAAGVTGGEPKPAPDFVSRTRTSGTDYVPVGSSAPRRDYRSKTAAEVGTAEAELERLRTRNEARGRTVRQPGTP